LLLWSVTPAVVISAGTYAPALARPVTLPRNQFNRLLFEAQAEMFVLLKFLASSLDFKVVQPYH
jgi:hypothetical protein